MNVSEQTVEDVALACVEQAYRYYITFDNTWDDFTWDTCVKYVIYHKQHLPLSLRKVFDRVDERCVSMFFLTLEDYKTLGVAV